VKRPRLPTNPDSGTDNQTNETTTGTQLECGDQSSYLNETDSVPGGRWGRRRSAAHETGIRVCWSLDAPRGRSSIAMPSFRDWQGMDPRPKPSLSTYLDRLVWIRSGRRRSGHRRSRNTNESRSTPEVGATGKGWGWGNRSTWLHT